MLSTGDPEVKRMTCPKCHSEFDNFENTNGVCPECGVRLLRNISGVMKTSAVMIAARGEREFYRSVQDVPEPLRTQLLEVTASSNSGTIVIADRAGKQQLTRGLARREAGREEIQAPQSRSREAEVPEVSALTTPSPVARAPWVVWAGFVIALAVAAILFAVFHTGPAIFQIR
jgi:hypothetical protein